MALALTLTLTLTLTRTRTRTRTQTQTPTLTSTLTRYVSKAEQMLGRDWRKKMADHGLFWDQATQGFINKGQRLMMQAPGAPLAQKSLVAPELHRSRVGIGSESEARQMGFRLDSPTRSRVTPDSAWELPLLQGPYAGITPPGTLGIVGGSLSALFGSPGLPSPLDKPVRQARLREQSRFRKDLGRVHEDMGIHDFLASSKRARARREERVSTATAAARLCPPRRSTVTYDMKRSERLF